MKTIKLHSTGVTLEIIESVTCSDCYFKYNGCGKSREYAEAKRLAGPLSCSTGGFAYRKVEASVSLETVKKVLQLYASPECPCSVAEACEWICTVINDPDYEEYQRLKAKYA